MLRNLTILIAYAAAMALLKSAVVVYLRRLGFPSYLLMSCGLSLPAVLSVP